MTLKLKYERNLPYKLENFPVFTSTSLVMKTAYLSNSCEIEFAPLATERMAFELVLILLMSFLVITDKPNTQVTQSQKAALQAESSELEVNIGR